VIKVFGPICFTYYFSSIFQKQKQFIFSFSLLPDKHSPLLAVVHQILFSLLILMYLVQSHDLTVNVVDVVLLIVLYPDFSFQFQDLLNTLKSCLSCDEAFQYAQYVSTLHIS